MIGIYFAGDSRQDRTHGQASPAASPAVPRRRLPMHRAPDPFDLAEILARALAGMLPERAMLRWLDRLEMRR
jgi:hypothetical protein